MATRRSRRRRAAAAGLAAAIAGSLAGAACGADDGSSAPVDAPRGVAIAVGGGESYATFSHACAVVDGEVQCWGAGGQGQLGDRLLPRSRPLPARVAGLRGVTQVAVGLDHSCAIASGRLHCWGSNVLRQLGGREPRIAIEPRPVPVLGRVTRVAAASGRTCAIQDGALYCWGLGRQLALGAATEERCGRHGRVEPCSATPLHVAGLREPVREVAIGRLHGCAIDAAGLQCWGHHRHGQLGREGPGGAPAPVEGLPDGVSAVSVGDAHSCAIADGALHCWGSNAAGQLGDGSRVDRPRPTRVTGLPTPVTAVAAGNRHTCAIAAGRVYCFGDSSEGQVGRAGSAVATPFAVPPVGEEATAVAAGRDLSCAVWDGATVACWGDDDFGQRGLGRRPAPAWPTPVADWDRGQLRDLELDGARVVACVGDSNTATHGDGPGWCEQLPALLGSPPWRAVNRGLGGATVTDRSLRTAREQLDYVLAHDAPDVVIAAFGTNDAIAGASADQLLDAYQQLRRRTAESGVALFVALTPPVNDERPKVEAAIEAGNAKLREVLPPERLIDFASGVGPDDFRDPVHLGPTGQARRARAAAAALRAAGASQEQP